MRPPPPSRQGDEALSSSAAGSASAAASSQQQLLHSFAVDPVPSEEDIDDDGTGAESEVESRAKERRPLLDHTPTSHMSASGHAGSTSSVPTMHLAAAATRSPPGISSSPPLHPLSVAAAAASGGALHVRLPHQHHGGAVNATHPSRLLGRRPSDGGAGSGSMLLPTSLLGLSSAAGGDDGVAHGTLMGAGGMLASVGSSLSASSSPRLPGDRATGSSIFGASAAAALAAGSHGHGSMIDGHSSADMSGASSGSSAAHGSSGGHHVSHPSRTWVEGFMSWLAPEAAAPSLSTSHDSTQQHAPSERELTAQHYGLAASTLSPRLAHATGTSDGASSSAFSNDTLSAGVAAPSSRLSSSSWHPCLISCGWVCFALLLLFLSVGIVEYHMDSNVHASRLALLELPDASHSSADADAVISLHESAVQRQKELNKRLGELADREGKIHYLHAEMANKDLMIAQYKVVVARLKALQAQHLAMEQRKSDEERTVEAIMARGPLPPELLSGGDLASSSPADLAKYRARLMALLFGNKTLEQTRREYEQGIGAGSVPTEHQEEIAKLLREEKEAQALAAGGGFLAAVAHRAAILSGEGGSIGAGRNADLKLESVMRIQEDEGIIGGLGGGGHGGGGGGGGHGAEGGADGGDSSMDDPDHPALGPDGLPLPRIPAAPADKLVDSDKNEYILSKPGDSSGAGSKSVDARLVQDLGIVIVASALGGLAASALRQPVLLGYLAGGSAIGPGGLKLIGQFIQIETLAQFGATFLLFALGVEFSLSKLRRVKHIALAGGLLQLGSITFVVSLFCVHFLELRMKQSVFIGAVLGMSSTTVVVKSLMASRQIATLGGQVMLGLLIAQDLFLSVMLALMNLARVPLERLATESLWLLLRFTLLASIVLVCMYVWPWLLRLLDSSRSPDLFLLGLVALCVFLTVVSEAVIHSAEVGAFLSGILISSAPGGSPELTHRSLRLFAPIRDMFGALFFSSIGMLIHPGFLVRNCVSIVALVVATVLVKSFLTALIVRMFGYSTEISLRAGLGLSQVGEFAFVLASEGVAQGLLSRTAYEMVVGVTVVSLMVTPAVLLLAEWTVKWIKPDGSGSSSGGSSGGTSTAGGNATPSGGQQRQHVG